MARVGYGFGSVSRLLNSASASAKATIVPGENWDGTAGSGFTSIPTDPVRTTAKPVLRLITPPKQRFSSSLTIGVRAAANNAGTLFDSDGLSYVRVHYEGNVTDIAAPGPRTLNDTHGNSVCYWGWWCELEYTGDGASNVYFEAVPTDPSMQSRIVGPYTFHPNANEWELDYTVNPDLPISGTNFHDINPAINAMKQQGANGALRVQVQKAGDYALTDRNWNRGADAEWLVVEATVPGVRFSQDLQSDGTLTYFRPRFEPVCFRKCEFDFIGSSEYYFEPGWARNNWFDGCNFTNSNGRNDAPLKLPRNKLAWILRGRHWITECSFSNLWNSATGQHLVRGCTFTHCWSDLANGTYAFIGNRVEDFDGSYYRDGMAALSVEYSGPAASATIAASGIGPKTFTLREGGTSIGTFIAQTSKAAFVADTEYTVQNLADWINAQPGWLATVLDDKFAAFALCRDSGSPQAAFTAHEVKSAPLTLHTKFDIHADIYQLSGNAAIENIVIAENRMWNVDAQNIFLTAPGGFSDVMIVNNAFENHLTSGAQSQFSSSNSHLVIAHNSFASQIITMRSDSTFNPDAYCLIANNTSQELRWGGAADPDPVIAHNHIHADATDPAGATGTYIGGDFGSLFADPSNGDFRPGGDLLINGQSPVLRGDLNCAKRSTFGAVGAVGKAVFG